MFFYSWGSLCIAAQAGGGRGGWNVRNLGNVIKIWPSDRDSVNVQVTQTGDIVSPGVTRADYIVRT